MAAVNSLHVLRYITVQLPFTILAQLLAVWLAVEFLMQLARGLRPELPHAGA